MTVSYRRAALIAALMVAAGLPAPPAEAGRGDWLVRARLIHVNPNDSTGAVSGIAGTEAGVDSDTTLELDFTYMLTDRLGLELILATTKHEVEGTRGAVRGADVGSVRLLPPVVALQYHFQPEAKLRPYVGVGINYTHFYDATAGSGLGPGASVDYDDAWGVALQAGLDMDLGRNWYLNVDLKYVDLDTTLTITGGAVPGKTDVTLNPWVLGLGIGTRF